MQSENKKEDQGYIISLVLTTTCFPAYFFLIFLLMFLPFHNTPKFISVIISWIPVIWQVVSCYYAVDYIQRNPHKQMPGVISFVFAVIVLLIAGAATL